MPGTMITLIFPTGEKVIKFMGEKVYLLSGDSWTPPTLPRKIVTQYAKMPFVTYVRHYLDVKRTNFHKSVKSVNKGR